MKRFILIISVFAVLQACASQNVMIRDFPPQNTVHYSQLKKNSVSLEQLGSYAIMVNQGDTIPFDITLKTVFFEISKTRINLKAKQKMYFMVKTPLGYTSAQVTAMNEEQLKAFYRKCAMFISNDARRWAPVADTRALKEVFSIQSGSISLGMYLKFEESIRAFLDVCIE